MDILAVIEDIFFRLRNLWLGWRGRMRAALAKMQKKLDPHRYQAILEMLEQAHAQAQQVLDGGPVPETRVPWELSHGLELLDQLGDRKALPKTPAELATCVLPDGSLLGCRQWELLDFRWTEALVAWLENLDEPAHFGATPALITMPNNITLAIAGDWGTGPFERNAAATRVAEIIKNMAPDYTFHLGDVYYAGTKAEEKKILADWPRGKSGAFTLNSNHEMYSGAKPYFTALQNDFLLQQGTSYFALQNDHWLVIGLDSAYASDPFNLYMDGDLNQPQIDWLRALPKNKSVIVLSHGQACDIDGKKKTVLYDQVVKALGAIPAYWYWGHLHNAICYVERDGLHGRCVGHGSIPYGVAAQLEGNANVSWYEKQLAGDSNYPLRVLNGYMKVALSGTSITEQFIGEDGSVRWSSS
jgi:hypothetical protein